ncbi:MAG: transcription termination factor Rho [Ilumatobacter sp.]|nr:transcription termination factor Rho [Ilumatobacter sp.]
MAKALGVKANARLKKSDIIDKILDSTGPSSAAASSNGAADAAPDRSDGGAAKSDGAEQQADGPAPATDAPKSSPDGVVLGEDGEPLADWELALREQGVDTTTRAVGDSSAGEAKGGDEAGRGESKSGDTKSGDTKRTDGNRDGSKSGDGKSGDGKRTDGNRGGDAKSGDGNRNRNDGNRNRNDGNRNDGNRNRNDDGGGGEGGNKRRRRRRKGGRGGQEGPQGEDLELLDQEGQPLSNEPTEVTGYLDVRDEGYGFLRVNGYLPSKADAYITVKVARQYGLRRGDLVVGMMRPAQRNEKNPQLIEVKSVNGGDPEAAKKRPRFEDLTALFPDQQLRLEDPSDPANMTARIIDLISPIGKGQRGIIVSPPKAGKTTVMKTIAKSIELNDPDVELIVLLIDERPEEVTDMKRSVQGEVISSTFDRPSDEHTHVAEMAIAKARRMVEQGKDVVIILDGITRLSRAYNLAAPASGKILSGGIDAGALYPPKKFFGSARNVEEGGSLTILATALVDTNSRMDEAIFEEFKGTGNMELRLDRRIAERRIYPAIDVDASSTRHEELLFDRKQLQMVWKLRRVLSGLAADGNAAPGLELLIDRLKTFRTNAEFLSEIAKQPGM